MSDHRSEPLPSSDKTVLVMGGTGSFGRRCVEILRTEKRPRKIIVFSRDERRKYEMQQVYPADGALGYIIGRIRDADRLRTAFEGVDVVVHAAAMKQIPTCEYNVFEAIQTNVIGARDIIAAALDRRVERARRMRFVGHSCRSARGAASHLPHRDSSRPRQRKDSSDSPSIRVLADEEGRPVDQHRARVADR